MQFWRGWKYYCLDYQPLREGWRLWFYRVYYDGHHCALHLGPVVLGWGDGTPPNVRNSTQ